MGKQKVGIAAECICDLPREYLKENDVTVIYFLVKTDRGEFLDTDEITAENIIGYMKAKEHVPISSPPSYPFYAETFEKMLKTYEEVIFVATGSKASLSYGVAVQAVEAMGELGQKVHIFDSMHLSTGLGHIVIKAVELAKEGYAAGEILAALTELQKRVSTTFITVDADYLYRNGRVSMTVKRLCDTFGIHPVLVMKNGGLTLKSVLFGNYDRACLRYVRQSLRHADRIDKTRIFVTQVGLTSRKQERIKEEIQKRCRVEELIVTQASATISSNCGPGTFGVLYVKQKR